MESLTQSLQQQKQTKMDLTNLLAISQQMEQSVSQLQSQQLALETTRTENASTVQGFCYQLAMLSQNHIASTAEIASLKDQLLCSQASELTLTETLWQVQADKTEMENSMKTSQAKADALD